jgi:hypothetical protein
MVSAHPKIAISNLIGKLKGKSSYMLRKSFFGANKVEITFGHQATLLSLEEGLVLMWLKMILIINAYRLKAEGLRKPSVQLIF